MDPAVTDTHTRPATSHETGTETGPETGHWHAWTDLGERITSGLRSLWGLKADYQAKGNTEQVERLDGKVNGVLIGQNLYLRIQSEFIDAPHIRGEAPENWQDAYETAWLTLTARLYETAQAEPDPSIRNGLLTVNRLQTGYGHDIDAPQIVPA